MSSPHPRLLSALADLVVHATPRLAETSLQGQVGDVPVHLAGDCMAPRNLMAAIDAGEALAERL